MRLDISVQGPIAPNGSIYMIDVSVVAINSIKSTVPDIIKKDETNKTNKKSSIYQNTQEEIQSILNKRHQLKISKYQPLTTIQVSTFTISSGGTIHKKAIELIK